MRRVHLYFAYASASSYLAFARITQVHPERYRGVEVLWKPVRLAGLAGLPGEPRSREAYDRADAERWARAYGVPFAFPPSRPPGSTDAAKAHLLAEMEGPRAERRWLEACMRAQWVDGKDLGDRYVLDGLAAQCGLPRVSDRLDAAGVVRLLDANTVEAAHHGALGAPFAFLESDAAGGGEAFHGHDRLAWLEWRLGTGPDPTR